MCGIAGFVKFGEQLPSREVLSAMAHALRRRGPDARGVLIDGACGLAHARLSIIDLEGSPQPMRVGGSDVSVVYNGELYNYALLRQQLVGQGVRFDSKGDTEVLLRWVEQEWEQALPRFDGMFGFAAWHRTRKALLLGRDPLGVKPLFYACPEPGLLVFGSEIKALLEHPAVGRELDVESLRQVLRFRAVYGEATLYKGVRQLAPGSWLEFSAAGIRSGRHYELRQRIESMRQEVPGTDDEACRLGRELLTDAVRKRLVADVPVGAFLSGGIDSSMIVALMRRLRSEGEEVCTFSVGFAQDPHSELAGARQVAEFIGTRHHETLADPQLYESRLAELTACRDAPISEPADVAIAQMSRHARQVVKVVLSGEGADEVFAGYPKHAFASTATVLRGLIRGLGPDRTTALAGLLGLDRRRVQVAARAMGAPCELDRLTQWFSYFDRGELSAMLPRLGWTNEDWSATTAVQAHVLRDSDHLSPLGRMQLLDCLTWLPGNLLERGDRMTMAEGLEMRVPFLDKRLVPFGLALADRLKIRRRSGKWIIRQLARDLVPAEVVTRRKWGFRVPLAQWFRGPLRAMLNDYLRSRRGICAEFGDLPHVDRMLDAHQQGRLDANLTLWTLLVTEVWYQDVYRSSRQSPAEPEPVSFAAPPAIA